MHLSQVYRITLISMSFLYISHVNKDHIVFTIIRYNTHRDNLPLLLRTYLCLYLISNNFHTNKICIAVIGLINYCRLRSTSLLYIVTQFLRYGNFIRAKMAAFPSSLPHIKLLGDLHFPSVS